MAVAELLETKDETLHLPRILCLHGGGTNARIFRAQCRVLRAELRSEFRLCFAEAPFLSQPGPDVVSVYREYGPFRGWFRSEREHPEIDHKTAVDLIDESLHASVEEDDRQGATGEWPALSPARARGEAGSARCGIELSLRGADGGAGASGLVGPGAGSHIANLTVRTTQPAVFPYKGNSATLPAETSHQDVTLTRESTSALVAACKKHNVSVSAAVHTALARTVFSFAPWGDQPTEHMTVMATNLRAYLQPPYDTKVHACQTYVASITPTVRRSSGFSDAALALTREYKSWHSAKFSRALRCIYKCHADRLFAPRATSRPEPPSGVTLSSLGVIERYLTGEDGDGGRVDKFRFGVSMMTRQMLLYAWTFGGQLTLSVNYNTAYYDDSMAQEVLSRIKATMAKELGLILDATVP